MKSSYLNRAVSAVVIGALSLLSTTGAMASAPVRQDPQEPPPPAAAKTGKKGAKQQKAAVKPARKPRPVAEPQAAPRVVAAPENATIMEESPARQPRVKPTPPRNPNVAPNPQREPRVVATPEPQPQPRVVASPERKPRTAARPARLPRERQQELIVQQRDRNTQYRQRLYDQESVAQQRAAALRQERRNAQYRYQQQYYEALRRQRIAIDNARYYNYNNDPYYYTAPSYRYSRAGSYYETNRYGADLLRQAVNYGYQQGFQAGRADRQDRWSNSGYEDSFAYQDANYGYNGRYVDQDTYNHYFREGFQRGYEDGNNNRYEYGRRSSGSTTALVVLASVLAGIVVFEAIDD